MIVHVCACVHQFSGTHVPELNYAIDKMAVDPMLRIRTGTYLL